MEPPVKKCKTVNIIDTIDKCIEMIKQRNDILPVLSDDVVGTIETEKVYVGSITNSKDISRVILTLNEKLPLNSMQHLKRVKKNDVVLCCTSSIGESSIQEFIEENVPELKNMFSYFKVSDVPKYPPKTVAQFRAFSRTWSCNFHRNEELEMKISGNYIKKQFIDCYKYMHITFEVLRWSIAQNMLDKSVHCLFETNAAVVYDPMRQAIVTIALDNRKNHPIQHAAMVAIDNVAKTQNGGSWNTTSETVYGIESELYNHLKVTFPDVQYGARQYICKDDLENNSDSPYLCTNYYIFLIREPCLMCSMALVHARVKIIFYAIDDIKKGALKSRIKLHTESLLNHRYEVFTGFIQDINKEE